MRRSGTSFSPDPARKRCGASSVPRSPTRSRACSTDAASSSEASGVTRSVESLVVRERDRRSHLEQLGAHVDERRRVRGEERRGLGVLHAPSSGRATRSLQVPRSGLRRQEAAARRRVARRRLQAPQLRQLAGRGRCRRSRSTRRDRRALHILRVERDVVAELVTAAVVDGLQTVAVDDDHGELAAGTLGPFDLLLEAEATSLQCFCLRSIPRALSLLRRGFG